MKQPILYTLACLALLLVASSGTAFAQGGEESAVPTVDDVFIPEFRVGVSGGFTKNVHQEMMSTLMQSMGCISEFLEERVEWGSSVGLAMNYKFSPRSGIAAHLLYSTRPGSAQISLPSSRVLLPGADPSAEPTIVTMDVETQIAVECNLLEFDLMSTVELLSMNNVGLGLSFGGAVAHIDVLNESVSMHLLTPKNARFANYGDLPTRDSGRVLVYADDDPVEDPSSVRFSLRTGAYLDVSLFAPLHITPGVYYDYGLTRLVKGYQWTVNSLLFQLDVTMEL